MRSVTSENYEIRYLRADGTLSLLYVTSCASDDHARDTALQMFADDFAAYEIWHGPVCVEKGVQLSAAS